MPRGRFSKQGDYRIVKVGNRFQAQRLKTIFIFDFWKDCFLDFDSLEKAKSRIIKQKKRDIDNCLMAVVIWEESKDPLYPKPDATPPPKRNR